MKSKYCRNQQFIADWHTFPEFWRPFQITRYTSTQARTRYPKSSRRTLPIVSIPSLICKTWLLQYKNVILFFNVNRNCNYRWKLKRLVLFYDYLLPVLFNRRWRFVFKAVISIGCRILIWNVTFRIIAIFFCPCAI